MRSCGTIEWVCACVRVRERERATSVCARLTARTCKNSLPFLVPRLFEKYWPAVGAGRSLHVTSILSDLGPRSCSRNLRLGKALLGQSHEYNTHLCLSLCVCLCVRIFEFRVCASERSNARCSSESFASSESTIATKTSRTPSSLLRMRCFALD